MARRARDDWGRAKSLCSVLMLEAGGLRRPFGSYVPIYYVPLTTCGSRPREARRGASAPRRAYVFVAEAKHLISVVAEP